MAVLIISSMVFDDFCQREGPVKYQRVRKIFQFFLCEFNVMMDKKLKSLLLVIKCSWIVYCAQR